MSRVECLLRLPSVDVVFSSTKSDLDSSASDMSVTSGNNDWWYMYICDFILIDVLKSCNQFETIVYETCGLFLNSCCSYLYILFF